MVVVSVDGLEMDDWRGKDLRSMWGDWGTVVCGETGFFIIDLKQHMWAS